MDYDSDNNIIFESDNESTDMHHDNTDDVEQQTKEKVKPGDFEGKPQSAKIGNIPGRLKRKVILMVIAGVVMGSVCIMYATDSKEKKKKNAEEQQLYGAEAPNFTTRKVAKNQEERKAQDDINGQEEASDVPVFVRQEQARGEQVRKAQQEQYTQMPRTERPVNYSLGDEEVSPIQKEVPGIKYKNSSYGINGQRYGTSVPTSGGFNNSSLDDLVKRYGPELGSSISGYGNYAGSSYQNQNNQSDKRSFYDQGRDSASTGGFLQENTVWVGTLIPAVLINGINTDLPGDLLAIVSENVYDSETGKVLLIPQGSRLFASYNSNVSFAQSRVQVAWNTLTRPDGFEINLGNMNGVDMQGYSGYKGKMDEHLFKWVQAAGIISAFTVLNSEIEYEGDTTQNKTLKNVADANQNAVTAMSAGIINRTLDIQPTITVKPGTAVKIQINKTIALPGMERYPVVDKYVRD
jgi:type IV secretion system protein VirB10